MTLKAVLEGRTATVYKWLIGVFRGSHASSGHSPMAEAWGGPDAAAVASGNVVLRRVEPAGLRHGTEFDYTVSPSYGA